MTSQTPRKSRLRLEARAYRCLRREVLDRDSWRCQQCGRISGLEVHHQIRRSEGGGDLEDNLISLCTACHKETHNG